MKTSPLFVVVVILAGLLATDAVQAQPHPGPPPGGVAPPYRAPPPPGSGPSLQPAHQGFYIGFSLGAGGLKFADRDSKSSSREESVALTLLRLGVALHDRLLVGANLGGWSKTYEDDISFADRTVTLVRINAEAICYPFVGEADVFVRGGLGVARLGVEIGDVEVFNEQGAAMHVGAGIERRLTTRFALGVSLDWHFARLTEEVDANYWEAALQFTWY
jgi:opacity protein-like surface antigen